MAACGGCFVAQADPFKRDRKRMRFGYWMPLGSGGFVISNVPQRTDWSLEYNADLAKTA